VGVQIGGPEPSHEWSEDHDRNFKRNFNVGVINGTLYIGGLAFSEPATVLPVFVSLFTGSSILIGLTGTLTSVGWLLPQLAVARYAEHLPTKMRMYKMAALFRLTAWLCLVISVSWADELDPTLYLLIFFLCLGAFSLVGGASGIAFMDIVAKTIPPERRGRYFGYRSFFSGFIAALAGLVVAYVLGNPDKFPFPNNYFILFSLTFVFVLAAVVVFLFTIEPEGTVKPQVRTSGEFMGQVKTVLSTDRNFRKFLMVMILANTWAMTIPFYVIYATEILGAPVAWVGIYVTIEMISIIVSNLIWGYLGDTRGNRMIILTCISVALLATLLALISPNYVFFSLVFVLKGTASRGLWLGKNNYSLEIAPITRRPTYVGILNTSLAFAMMTPIVGGIIIDVASYWVLFSVTAILIFISLLKAFKLEEPRKANSN
jgi:MFS family permease